MRFRIFYEVSCLACILYITTFLLQRQQVQRLYNRSDCSLLFVQFGISLIHTCFSEPPRWAEFAFYFLQETTVENGRKRFSVGLQICHVKMHAASSFVGPCGYNKSNSNDSNNRTTTSRQQQQQNCNTNNNNMTTTAATAGQQQ